MYNIIYTEFAKMYRFHIGSWNQERKIKKYRFYIGNIIYNRMLDIRKNWYRPGSGFGRETHR